MKKFPAIIAAIVLTVFATAAFAACEELGIPKAMLTPSFWIARTKEADRILLSAEEIEKFNANICVTPRTHCANLLEYPKIVAGEEIKKAISPEKKLLPKNYVDGQRVTQNFLQSLVEECNIEGIKEQVPVCYAFAADNLKLRALPTLKSSYKTAQGKLFDRYTVSSVKIWEPLIVLHGSKSGKWLFVRTKNCDGWVEAGGVAFCDRAAFEEYQKPPFVVVTGAKIYPREGLAGRRHEFLLGTKLPLAAAQENIVGEVSSCTSKIVLLPENDESGNFAVRELLIPDSADIHEGYLGYTQENLLRTAFKLLGEAYGWGGDFAQWDCSALIHDVYSVFGFDLPRNSLVQTRIPSFHAETQKMRDEEKERLLSELPAGTFVQMPGHIMLYLGTVNGKPYILHEVYALHRSSRKIHINCAAVTNMDMQRANGKKIISSIENINAIK